MKTKNKSKRSKEIVGITLAAIMIASIFAIVAPTTVAKPVPPTPPWGGNYSSVRIYGDVQPHGNAPERYDSWTQPFDPTVIPKDSFTCNPAIYPYDLHLVKVNNDNAAEKVFLRAWYEPCGKYWGPRKNHTYPTINLEYTYMLVNGSYMPVSGKPDPAFVTKFMFPTREKAGLVGLSIDELVTLTGVQNDSIGRYDKTTNGTIRIENRSLSGISPGDKVQFLDHKLQYVGQATTGAVIKVWYAGNVEDDTPKGFIVLTADTTYYFDRHNNMYTTAEHPDRTWFVKWTGNEFYIGKELRKCDVFYVNGVRYDVTAVEVLDTDGVDPYEVDSFKFITIRTKLPKGHDVVQDESVVSTQRIEEFAPAELIAVLPPFNRNYSMVDDIDIPLRTGGPERGLTQQPWDYSYTKPVGNRILDDVTPLNMTYIAETVEKRYSTNLLEKLNEVKGDTDPVYESWTKFDVQTLPDQYTEFVLPPRPDIPEAVSLGLYGDYLITTSLIAPQAGGDLYDNKKGGDSSEQRVAFSYDPVDGEDDIDIYVNYNVGNKVNTVRIYGAEKSNPYDNYDDWEQPFNPTVIRKDSITFDTAILRFSPEYSMTAQNENCDLKTYLRAWYDTNYLRFEHPEPAVVTETTYMLIDSQDKKPFHGEVNDTYFAFPIVSDLSDAQFGLDKFENPGVTEMNTSVINLVRLVNVTNISTLGDLNKTTGGLIRIEKEYILAANESVQFLDHLLKFEPSPTMSDRVGISYAGNGDIPAITETWEHYGASTFTPVTFFDRNNNDYGTPLHPDRTWYARYEGMLGSKLMITVGKELQQGDRFYVDGVRYEIPAIEVLDWDRNLTNGAEKFKFITLRTPFPKYLGGLDYKLDDTALSQYIWKLRPCNATPALPPYNMDHEIVDDTDVVLWQPLQHLHKWPYGDPRDPTNYFRFGERYLTMQHPSLDIDSWSDIEGIGKWIAWAWYFRVIPIDTDDDILGGYGICEDWAIPKDPEFWDSEIAYAAWMLIFLTTDELQEHWIANDVDERIIDADPLEFCWKSESVEPRYSTNLVEILNETITGCSPIVESWTKYDIRTLPDCYTEFKLPVIPSLNPVCYVGGDYQDDFEPDISEYPGSYLITTSFYAPNAKGDLNLEQEYDERDRFAFTYNASDGTGIYMNENVTMPIPPVGDRFEIALHEGPNYVSMPVLPDNKNPKAIFGSEVNVWGYDIGTGNWETVSAVAKGTGYYAYAPKPKTVTVYGTGVSLPTWTDIENANPWTSGWNLVGPGNTSVAVPPSGVQILRYSRVYHDFLPVPPSDKLEPGIGYWAYK